MHAVACRLWLQNDLLDPQFSGAGKSLVNNLREAESAREQMNLTTEFLQLYFNDEVYQESG